MPEHERPPVIEVCGVTAGYTPGVSVLHGVDLHLHDREIVSIIGPNGAGKSTLIKAIFGLVTVTDGTVHLHGRKITGSPPHRLVQDGVAYVPQRENVFPTLSVRENLEMGGMTIRSRIPARLRRMYGLFPRLRERAGQAAGSLSGGERQMVAFARALMCEPSVLLLDEPSAGLAPAVVSDVFRRIRRIRDHGVSVLLVEQAARAALAMSDRGYVLDQGRNGLTGTGQELLDDPRVGELYLGGAGRR